MTDVPTANVHSYDRETARYQRLIHEAESIEIEKRERRSFSSDTGGAILWMLTVPGTVVFLGACVWAIATNG